LPPPQRGGGGPPKFSAHVYCDQTALYLFHQSQLGFKYNVIPVAE